MPDADFGEFFAALRRGEPRAADEFARRYAPLLRRVVRLRLAGSRLRRLFDSLDFCQSVLAGLLPRFVAGRYEPKSDEELAKLLVTAALNRVRYRLRGLKSHGGGLPDGWDAPDGGQTPGEAVARLDLAGACWERLSGDERWLFEQSAVLGRGWEEIAREVGGSPDALRVRLRRACVRVRAELECREVNRVS
jgi:DNA-directed RNA polymerase specialized sigma24 family protein